MEANSTAPKSIDQIMSDADFRISPDAFTASIFTFLALSIIIAAYRIYLRFAAFGRLGTDDYFMIAAVLCFVGSVGVTQWSRYLLYLQMAVAMVGGNISDGDYYATVMLDLSKLDNAQYMLEWTAIYCVKFSYLFFFRPLVKRIPAMEIWWKILVALMTAIALPTIFLSVWVCPHYDASYVEFCVRNGSVYLREQTLLTLSTATDIATDILVISIPIFLLARVQLELKRKLALGAVLCLSVVMIIIAVIRYALCSVQGITHPVPDSVWLFFWQAVECFVAISMVSLTAFRSLYGQARARTQHGPSYINVTNVEKWRMNKQSPDRSITKSVNIDVTSEAKVDEELQFLNTIPKARLANEKVVSWDHPTGV